MHLQNITAAIKGQLVQHRFLYGLSNFMTKGKMWVEDLAVHQLQEFTQM
jgi:hypothetical protein